MYGERKRKGKDFSIEEQILQFPRCTGKRVAGNLRLTFSGRDYRTYCIATLLNSALNFREDLRKGREIWFSLDGGMRGECVQRLARIL